MSDLLPAFLIGLFGSTHCLAMCGGIAIALQMAPHNSLRPAIVTTAYNTGRIVSYGLIGLLLGGIVGLLAGVSTYAVPMLRVIAGVLLVLMGLYVAGWLGWITTVERLGQPLWSRLKPLAGRLLPVSGYGQAMLAGALWGWLPCGLVYSTLAWAVARESTVGAGALMIAFGVGTLPSMWLAGMGGSRLRDWISRRQVRVLAGLLLIVAGVWTASQPLLHLQHGSHPQNLSDPAAPTVEHAHSPQRLVDLRQ